MTRRALRRCACTFVIAACPAFVAGCGTPPQEGFVGVGCYDQIGANPCLCTGRLGGVVYHVPIWYNRGIGETQIVYVYITDGVGKVYRKWLFCCLVNPEWS